MKFCFILDNMLPKALAEFLISNGHEAHTAARLKTGSNSDQSIWSKAEEMRAVLITKDADFDSIIKNSTKEQLVHYRGGNVTTAHLLHVFEKNLPDVLAGLEAGELKIEFR
jgi:predicted nuclease of predicted toxin-antitoxin system